MFLPRLCFGQPDGTTFLQHALSSSLVLDRNSVGVALGSNDSDCKQSVLKKGQSPIVVIQALQYSHCFLLFSPRHGDRVISV